MKSALLCTSILLLASGVIAQAPPAVVGVEEARSIDARSTLELPATVDSPLETVVAAEVSGRVIEVAVREGDRVKKGQRLARLRTTTGLVDDEEDLG